MDGYSNATNKDLSYFKHLCSVEEEVKIRKRIILMKMMKKLYEQRGQSVFRKERDDYTSYTEFSDSFLIGEYYVGFEWKEGSSPRVFTRRLKEDANSIWDFEEEQWHILSEIDYEMIYYHIKQLIKEEFCKGARNSEDREYKKEHLYRKQRGAEYKRAEFYKRYDLDLLRTMFGGGINLKEVERRMEYLRGRLDNIEQFYNEEKERQNEKKRSD